MPSWPNGRRQTPFAKTADTRYTCFCPQAASAIRKDIVQRVGSKTPLADLLATLARRLAPSVISPDHLRAAMAQLAAADDSQPSSSAGGMQEAGGPSATYRLLYNVAKVRRGSILMHENLGTVSA